MAFSVRCEFLGFSFNEETELSGITEQEVALQVVTS